MIHPPTVDLPTAHLPTQSPPYIYLIRRMLRTNTYPDALQADETLWPAYTYPPYTKLTVYREQIMQSRSTILHGCEHMWAIPALGLLRAEKKPITQVQCHACSVMHACVDNVLAMHASTCSVP